MQQNSRVPIRWMWKFQGFVKVWTLTQLKMHRRWHQLNNNSENHWKFLGVNINPCVHYYVCIITQPTCRRSPVKSKTIQHTCMTIPMFVVVNHQNATAIDDYSTVNHTHRIKKHKWYAHVIVVGYFAIQGSH